jgi:hypothetical protein
MLIPVSCTSSRRQKAHSSQQSRLLFGPKGGTFDVTFVGLAPNDMMVRLHQSGVMQNQYDGPCSYLMLNADVVRAFKNLTPGTPVRVYLDDKKVSSVTPIKASEAA